LLAVENVLNNRQQIYKCPGNSWDLRNCREKTGKTLCNYIRRFSKRCKGLPDVMDADVVTTFFSGTSNRGLVHELGRMKPRTTKKLLDIATNYAAGRKQLTLLSTKISSQGRRSMLRI
jgi:hypothetical protein